MSIHTLAPDCDTCFACHECGKTICADNEPVTCAHGDDPCCDDCCEAYHSETAREKAISQGDE